MKNLHEHIQSFKAKMDRKRTFSDRVADKITTAFGSASFFIFNALFFMTWIIWNNGWIPGVSAFDPYPYGMLTMVVSLEAIFLSIFVLISQNHASNTADLREEIDLQINVRAEAEITRLLILVDQIHDHLGLEPEDDAELRRMKMKINLESIEKLLEQEMNTQK